MGKGLLAWWRRRIVARGVAGAVLLGVPVAVAAMIGFGTSLSGVADGLSAVTSGPNAVPASAPTRAGSLNHAVVRLASKSSSADSVAGGSDPARETVGAAGGGGSTGTTGAGTGSGAGTATNSGSGGGASGSPSVPTISSPSVPDVSLPGGGSTGGATDSLNGTVDNVVGGANNVVGGVDNTVNGLLGQ
jgi:hypothetical protein